MRPVHSRWYRGDADGTILYFAVAALFMGVLMGHPFNLNDLGLLAVYSVGASFATVKSADFLR